jgi:hypothetical protein
MLAARNDSSLDRLLLLIGVAWCVWVVARGFSSGTIPLQGSSIRRSQDAPIFWLSIGIHLIGAVGMLWGFLFGTNLLK